MSRLFPVLLGLALGLTATRNIHAQQTSGPAAATATATPPSVVPASSAKLPPGHPPTTMPPGHPPTTSMPPGHPPLNRGPARRHPGPPTAGRSQVFQPRPDRVSVDQSLPVGTVDIRIVDADGKAMPSAAVTLKILRNNVERGETREQKNATTDAKGWLRFEGLATGTGISYRVSTQRDSATFASAPFGLKDQHGVSVLLHSYKPTSRLQETVLVIEAIVLLDVKQDAIAINHLLRVLNLGRTAFVAENMSITLPANYSAFNTQDSMSGIGIVNKDDDTAEIVGTFPPGKSELTFRYNLPLSSNGQQDLRLPLPPRVIATTILSSAGPGMGLKAEGFPPAQSGRRRDGQRVLQTVRRADLSRGLPGMLQKTEGQTLKLHISGIPMPGPGRWIALVLALTAVGGGASFLRKGQSEGPLGRQERRDDLGQAKFTLLNELVALERAHTGGEVGPRSYTRLRDALLDALARVVGQLEAITDHRKAGAGSNKRKGRRKTQGAGIRRDRGTPKT